MCDVYQGTDGRIVLDYDVRTTGYDSRSTLAPLKQFQSFTDIGGPMKFFDTLEHRLPLYSTYISITDLKQSIRGPRLWQKPGQTELSTGGTGYYDDCRRACGDSFVCRQFCLNNQFGGKATVPHDGSGKRDAEQFASFDDDATIDDEGIDLGRSAQQECRYGITGAAVAACAQVEHGDVGAFADFDRADIVPSQATGAFGRGHP